MKARKIMTGIPETSKVSLKTFAGNHWYLTMAGCVLSGVSAVLSLAPYYYMWLVIRDAIFNWDALTADVMGSGLLASGLAETLVAYGWKAVWISLLSMAVYYAALMCTHLSAFRTATNLKTVAMHQLTRLPVGYFKQTGSGKLRRIIDDGAGQTETYLAHQLPDLAGAFVTPVATLAVLLIFDWRFGLVSLLPVVIGVIFLFQMMGPGMETMMARYQDALEDMNNEAVEYVRGIPVVKTFQQSVFSFKNFHDSILRYRDWSVNYTLSMRLPMCCYTVSINGVFAFLIPAGMLLAGDILTNQSYTTCVLDLVFYVFFTPVCVSMMDKIMHVSENTMEAKDAVKRILNILDAQPLTEPEVSKRPADMSVEFDQVVFSYGEAYGNALNQVSFRIPEGGLTAVVGPSGGGKTTAASLIPRFFDVSSGSIRIGGVDVREMKTEELMKHVAFVFQDSRLFKKSILDNIRSAKPEASLEEVNQAVKAARCEDIIAKLPDGLNTVIGTKGVYLSGGECQRIALCRAILKDAPIVILDEASAFADPDNEYEIQKAFEELARGKTVLMIAHRLSTVCHADQILVMADGQVKERGNHPELLKQEGMYAAMWKEYQTSAAWKVGGANE